MRPMAASPLSACQSMRNVKEDHSHKFTPVECRFLQCLPFCASAFGAVWSMVLWATSVDNARGVGGGIRTHEGPGPWPTEENGLGPCGNLVDPISGTRLRPPRFSSFGR